MPMPNIDGDHRSASHQPQRLVIRGPDRLRQATAPSTEPSTPLTARRLLQRRQTVLPGPPADVEVDRIPELRARPRAAPPSRRVQSRSPPVAVSSRPATNLSTRSSIAARSSAVAQPLASTLANATAKRALAPARHVDVTAFPCVSAFSWHRSFAAAFLPAAFSSAAAHFSARVAAASTARTPASRPKATPTTPRSIRFIAPPLRASSRASDTTTSASQQRYVVLSRLVLGGLALASRLEVGRLSFQEAAMTVGDVGREGVRLVSGLTGVAISVPVVAGFVLLGAAVLVGRSLLDVGRKLLETKPRARGPLKAA